MTVEHFLIGLLAALLEAFVVGFFYQHFFIVRRQEPKVLASPVNFQYIPGIMVEINNMSVKLTRFSNGGRSPHKSVAMAWYTREQ